MKRKWWHNKVAYQIYPKSFMDTNGDGIGDLRGVISRLDYLKELGVDIIWLSPVYPSPFVDQGYDISDYRGIAKEFGTMEEFDELIAETKRRNMYIIMDLVVNHCSDRHAWFQAALKDPDGEYADYFYFRKGKNGKAPNNSRSYFGGPAWELVPGTDKYYLHMFAKEQPDLNWENPRLRREIYDMVNWWFEKGVAGFRIDAIINIKKDITFPDYEPDGPDGLVTCVKLVENAYGIGERLEELKHETFEKWDAFTVGEVFNMHEEELQEFIGEDGHFSSMFDFSAHSLTFGEKGWYDAKPLTFKAWRKALFDSQLELQQINAFGSNIIENHDEPRGASHYLPEYAQNEAGKKALATTTNLFRGLPFLYQGQEIGMTNVVRHDISEYDDISTKDNYRIAIEAGLTEEQAMKVCYENSRDNARTPMQWSAGRNGGFTTGTPWLAMNPNYTEINVAEQDKRADSVLAYYRRLLALRKSEAYVETFTYGTFAPAYEDWDGVMAYTRTAEDNSRKILVAANYGRETVELPLEKTPKEVLITNIDTEQEVMARIRETGTLTLRSCETAVLLL